MTSPISGDTVAQYLRDNPSFFDVHAELLASVTVPHPHGGRAVSLVEERLALALDRMTHERDLVGLLHGASPRNHLFSG